LTKKKAAPCPPGLGKGSKKGGCEKKKRTKVHVLSKRKALARKKKKGGFRPFEPEWRSKGKKFKKNCPSRLSYPIHILCVRIAGACGLRGKKGVRRPPALKKKKERGGGMYRKTEKLWFAFRES